MGDAPEKIWAVTEEDDVSAQVLGEVYAQQTPDGMVGYPTEYIRKDISDARIAEAVKAERERCADLAFNYEISPNDNWSVEEKEGYNNGNNDTAMGISGAIRAQAPTDSPPNDR